MERSENNWILIPTELIGSLPRSLEIVEAQHAHREGKLSTNHLKCLQEKDIRQILRDLTKTGSFQLTDGELTKPSFLTYPIYELAEYNYTFDRDDITKITYEDGHQRYLPHLTNAPFRYSTYAVKYLKIAQKFTEHPLKQAVIAPSSLSLVYMNASIENYSREQFLNDLINESEKDVRLCLQAGAEKVQLDFAKAKLSLKIDPTGQLLKQFISINNRLLERFNQQERDKLGVHICSGNDRGSCHSSDVDYKQVLKEVFQLKLNNFYIQLTTEKEPENILSFIGQQLLQPQHRLFIGVINPRDLNIETPLLVQNRIIQAVKYIPIQQLGTTDDCGFAPYNDNEAITRDIALKKISARVEGTKLAEEILNLSHRYSSSH